MKNEEFAATLPNTQHNSSMQRIEKEEVDKFFFIIKLWSFCSLVISISPPLGRGRGGLQQLLDFFLNVADLCLTLHDVVVAVNEEEVWNGLNVIIYETL